MEKLGFFTSFGFTPTLENAMLRPSQAEREEICMKSFSTEEQNCRVSPSTFRKIIRELRANGALYILALPGVISLILFSYLPMAGLVIVFKAYNFQDGIFGSPWVGFQNFRFLVADFPNAWRATSNTVILNVLFIFFGTLFAVLIAIIMNEIGCQWVRKLSQSVMFFPYFLSWVAMGSIFQMFLNDDGILNDILSLFSIGPVSWYSTPGAWRPILVIVNLIKNTGYNSIIYFAALTGFDTSYYEAAEIDGASRFKRIIYITIPLLMPSIMIMFMLSIGRILSGDLSMIFGMTNRNPMLFSTTEIIDTYVYRSVLQNGKFEIGSAVTLYQSVFGFLLVLLSNWLVGKFEKDYRLF